MMDLEMLLFIGGLLHFSLLVPGGLMPKVFEFRKSFAPLTPFLRKLVWVYFAFIGMTIVGFGLLAVFHSNELAQGTPIAASLCGLISIFWLARVIVQLFIFDVRAVKVAPILQLGYHCCTAVFVYLTTVFGIAAITGILYQS